MTKMALQVPSEVRGEPTPTTQQDIDEQTFSSNRNVNNRVLAQQAQKTSGSDFLDAVEIAVPIVTKNQPVVYHNISANEVYQRANEMTLKPRTRQVNEEGLVQRVDASTKAMVSSLNVLPEAENQEAYKTVLSMIERLDPQGLKDGKYNVSIVKDDALNARGLSGEILVTTGLLENLKNKPDALLGVLAHEIAHTQLKHAYLSPNTGVEKVITNQSSREDVIDFIANRFVVRSAEIDADIAAGNRLRELGVSTEDLESFVHEHDPHDVTEGLVSEYDKLMPRKEAELLATMLQGHPRAVERAKFIDPYGGR
jgi:hypothetical protein